MTTHDLINKRRNYILNMIFESGSFLRLPRASILELSDKFKCSESVIYSDIKESMKKIPLPDLNIFTRKLHSLLNLALKSANELALNGHPAIKKDGIMSILKATETCTKFLEDFGLKEKIADKLNVEATHIDAQSMLKIIENAKKKVKHKGVKKK